MGYQPLRPPGWFTSQKVVYAKKFAWRTIRTNTGDIIWLKSYYRRSEFGLEFGDRATHEILSEQECIIRKLADNL
jgi:hypothetical protein